MYYCSKCGECFELSEGNCVVICSFGKIKKLHPKCPFCNYIDTKKNYSTLRGTFDYSNYTGY